jgi:hypothetical protein
MRFMTYLLREDFRGEIPYSFCPNLPARAATGVAAATLRGIDARLG